MSFTLSPHLRHYHHYARYVLALAWLLLLLNAHSQDADDASLAQRLITISYDGGNRTSPDLRFGPYFYSHPEPEGIVAEVSNLTIFAQQAQLQAPEGVLIAEAEGQREASFEGGVRVARARLTATGSSLNYSEASGLGIMPERADIRVLPARAGDDITEIQADEVTFDVDTDVSLSRGAVTLVSGRQSAEAEELVYEEGRDLARMRSEGLQVTARRQGDNGELLIIADTLRVLTNEDQLLAIGNVTIIDGDIESTGDMVFFDDSVSRAEIFGNPAVSVNRAQGVTISGERLEQLIDLNIVEVLDASLPSVFDAASFDLSDEDRW